MSTWVWYSSKLGRLTLVRFHRVNRSCLAFCACTFFLLLAHLHTANVVPLYPSQLQLVLRTLSLDSTKDTQLFNHIFVPCVQYKHDLDVRNLVCPAARYKSKQTKQQ